jgi:hypothetical protein
LSSIRPISNEQTRFRRSAENLHVVVERFSLADADTLLYRFTIEDPDTWDRPWSGEYTWPATDKLVSEYACHEGNYARGSVLRGARHRVLRCKPKSADSARWDEIGLCLGVARRGHARLSIAI